jgi:hypothetical protein
VGGKRDDDVAISVAYLVARPEAILTTAAGPATRHLHADALELTAGITFGVWKKR